MIYLLDQNFFRAPELAILTKAEPRAKFVIPDVALLEMCKGDQWRETMRRSLATLAPYRTRVFHSISVGEGLRYEFQELRSIEGRLLPLEFRALVRSILKGVEDGSPTTGFNVVSAGILKAQEEMRGSELNHNRNEERLKTRTRIFEEVLRQKGLTHLKRASYEARLSLTRKVAIDLLLKLLCDRGASLNKAKFFLKKRPLALRFFLLNVRQALEWARLGGVRSLPPEKATNEVLDLDYVAIGSFFDRVLSKETRVITADKELRFLLDMRSPRV